VTARRGSSAVRGPGCGGQPGAPRGPLPLPRSRDPPSRGTSDRSGRAVKKTEPGTANEEIYWWAIRNTPLEQHYFLSGRSVCKIKLIFRDKNFYGVCSIFSGKFNITQNWASVQIVMNLGKGFIFFLLCCSDCAIHRILSGKFNSLWKPLQIKLYSSLCPAKSDTCLQSCSGRGLQGAPTAPVGWPWLGRRRRVVRVTDGVIPRGGSQCPALCHGQWAAKRSFNQRSGKFTIGTRRWVGEIIKQKQKLSWEVEKGIKWSGWSHNFLEGVFCFTLRHIYNVLVLLTFLTESEVRLRNFFKK